MVDFKKIKLGLDFLIVDDKYLLENNLNERTITHKLAEYYQILFRNWDVDCEYNKNLNGPKKIIIDSKEFLAKMAKLSSISIHQNEEMLRDDISEEDIKDLEGQLSDPKNIEYDEEFDTYLFLLTIENKVFKKTIYPDIIVHKRGTNENLIVIEVKKSNNKLAKSRYYDFLKLAVLVQSPEYKYKMGIFVDIPVVNDLLRFKSFLKSKSIFPSVYKYLPKLR